MAGGRWRVGGWWPVAGGKKNIGLAFAVGIAGMSSLRRTRRSASIFLLTHFQRHVACKCKFANMHLYIHLEVCNYVRLCLNMLWAKSAKGASFQILFEIFCCGKATPTAHVPEGWHL